MKIAILGLSNNFGGVERFIINTYKQLKNDKLEFYFLTSADNITYLRLYSNQDHIIYYVSRRKNFFKFKMELEDIFNEYNFDILWFNCCSLSNIEEIRIAHKYKVPQIIVHSHNGENMGNMMTKLLHTINKYRIHRYVTEYFACSNVAAKWMFKHSILKKVVIINNSIDTHKYTYDKHKSLLLKRKYGLEDMTIIGHVGRFHPQKNHKYIIDIFVEYMKFNPKSCLLLCGIGDLYDEIKQYVKEHNLMNSVIFLGQVNDMANIYQIFDLFLFPSLYEGLPFSLIEAQAAGIPCLISNKISKEIKLTNLIYFEDISKDPKIWANRLTMIQQEKTNTFEDICNAGFDLQKNKQNLLEILGISES